ncbi:MAG: DNA translocase FtsK [Anaerolineae bacterium]|nr:DNA translocase FtsK [Anaerolineae bacterium]
MSRMLRRYLEAQADQVEAVLVAHRTPGRITGGTVGPRLIRFILDPAPQTRLSDVRALTEDLAIALKVDSLRIDRTHEGIILEFPNPEPRPVTLTGLWAEVKPLPPVTALLGLTDDGAPLLARLSSPEVAHVLVAGTKDAGKTALLRTLAVSLVMSNRPDELRLLCIDLQRRAFRALAGLPHLVRPPVITGTEAIEALQSLTRLMEVRLRGQEHQPRTVVLIDEAADLALIEGRVSAESLLVRLAQRGHEAGIHLVVATRRPSAAVLSGVLRANFPLRLVGKVISADDARVAAGRGQTDAHLLNGRGDFLAVGGSAAPIRFQIAYIGDQEAQQMLSEQQRAAAAPLPVTAPTFTPTMAYSGGR